MKTATLQQAPSQWSEIVRWMTAGEEVQLTDQDRVVATLVPNPATSETHPDFLARAKAIWGDDPVGKRLSEVVAESRGGESGSTWIPVAS